MRGPEYEKKLKAINEAYTASLPVALNDIASLWDELLAEWDDTRAAALSDNCHRLAGSASMFGHAEIGRIACSIEDIFGKVVHKGQLLTEEEIASIGRYVDELRTLARRLPDSP
jgi:HPt (histidine-containing phosphotransfer) domain-containing protein